MKRPSSGVLADRSLGLLAFKDTANDQWPLYDPARYKPARQFLITKALVTSGLGSSGSSPRSKDRHCVIG
ncbi:MAG: hypothetical protein ACPHAN_10905 [Pseudomonadales bacterium]